GDDNYEAKTIQTMITLGWDTSVPNTAVIECPNGKLVNGYYTAPVKVHTETSDIKFQAPDGSIVSEYWLKKDGAYGMRSPYFFKTNDDGHISTNVGQIGSIKIDQTAPASFSVDITNPDNSNPIRKFFTTFFTFFAAKEWDVTVTVKDATSGFDRIEYDCGDGVVRAVETFTNTGSVVGSNDLITGKFKVPVGNKGKVKVWAYDRAGNCIGTHDKAGNLVPGYFRYEGDTINTDVCIVVDNTKPKISVSFENNSAQDVEDESGNHVFYFKDERKATIQIQEDNYYAEDVQIIVKPHGSNVAFSKDELVSKFGLKYDDKQPKIYLTFADDGWYDFDVKYTDRSGNEADAPDFGNSVAPKSFVIDRTVPVVTISFDKNVAQNEFYYSLAKSAKIEVTEVNYSYEKLELEVTMITNNGSVTVDKADLEVVQSKDGDKNVIDIIFAEGAEYDFKIRFTDLAGNKATIDYGGEESFHLAVPKPVYTVAGEPAAYTLGTSNDLNVIVNREPDDDKCFDHFSGVEIDGRALTEGTDFTAAKGSTVVTVKAAVLEALAEGEHTVKVLFDDGKVETKITVKAAEQTSPATGDGDAIFIWVALLAVSGTVLAIAYRKKRTAVR
ncbi:MAG: hypothetical protein J5547_00600, partial [Clostridia bacterium]|nr:hypothetical protein [Clostridia bacterium]